MLGRVRGCRAVAGDACGRSSRKARRREKSCAAGRLRRGVRYGAESDLHDRRRYGAGPCGRCCRSPRGTTIPSRSCGRERGAHQSYSRNTRVTDSAAAGTALATGHKTNNGMLGVLPDSTAVESMMAKAVRRGMATGLVVTCYLPMPRREPFMRISLQADARTDRRTAGRERRRCGVRRREALFHRTPGGRNDARRSVADEGIPCDRHPCGRRLRSRRARSSGCSHPSTCLMHTRGAATIFPAPSGRRWRFCRTTLRSGTRASCSWSRVDDRLRVAP